MKDCTFCTIYANHQGIIYENQYFFAQFDKFPVSPGHAEIIPKRHLASLLDLTQDEWAMLKSTLVEVIAFIEGTDLRQIYEALVANPLNEKSLQFCEEMLTHVGVDKKPDGYNIGVNEGKAAGRTIDHLHIHIIPRYDEDVDDPVGGIRHVIPGKGNYKK